MLNVKQESCEYELLKSFGLTRRGSAVGAGDAAAFPSRFFLGGKVIRFGQILLDLGEMWGNLGRSDLDLEKID